MDKKVKSGGTGCSSCAKGKPAVPTSSKRQHPILKGDPSCPPQESVVLCISSQGEVVYPAPSVQKLGPATGPCFNANDAEQPTAQFTITVSPATGQDQVCWSVNYSATNNSGAAITPSSLLLTLSGPGGNIQSYPISPPFAGPTIPNGTTANGVFSACTIVAAGIAPGDVFTLVGVLNYNSGCSTGPAGPVTVVTAPAQPCYYLGDTATANDGSTVTVEIIGLSGYSTGPSDCSDLTYIADQLGLTPPVPVPIDAQCIQICPDCFSGSAPIVFTIQTTINNTYPTCPTGLTDCNGGSNLAITNTATLIKEGTVDSTDVCTGDTCTSINPATTEPYCLSAQPCDIFTSQACVVFTCVQPQVCISAPTPMCSQQFCLCKTSTVVSSSLCPTASSACWCATANGQTPAPPCQQALVLNYLDTAPTVYFCANNATCVLNPTVPPTGLTCLPNFVWSFPLACVYEMFCDVTNVAASFLLEYLTAIGNENLCGSSCVIQADSPNAQFFCNAYLAVFLVIKAMPTPMETGCPVLQTIYEMISDMVAAPGNEEYRELVIHTTGSLMQYNMSGQDSLSCQTTTIQYDVTLTPQETEICTFSPSFAFYACPGVYSYTLYGIPGSGPNVPIATGTTTNICEQFTTCTSTNPADCADYTVCSTCPSTVSAACYIALGPFDAVALSSDYPDGLLLQVFDSEGNPLLPAGTAIPASCYSPVGPPLCASDCIAFSVTPPGGSPCTVPLDPSAATLNLDDYPPGAPVDELENLLQSLLGACGSTPGYLLTGQDIANFTEFGLHYLVPVPMGTTSCCGPATATNTFALTSNCSGSASSIATTLYTTGDPVNIPCPISSKITINKSKTPSRSKDKARVAQAGKM
jgi:hypothetical protein